MLRILAAIAALCAIGAFAGLIMLRDNDHWRKCDPRHVSRGAFRGAFIALVACCIAVGLCICGAVSAYARPAPYPGKVTPFVGDRYGSAQLGSEVTRSMGCPPPACQRKHTRKSRKHPTPHRQPRKRVVPGEVHPVQPHAEQGRNLFRDFADETVNKVRSLTLSGVVAPLASKAREIVSSCGSRVISAVRHTYIRGTGGRLSLHASGRAIDIAGNPSCIYSHLRNWPGGVSTDYHARGIQHVHFSYAPNGPEWGVRFAHYRGGHRHRSAKRDHHHRRYARRL